MKLHFIIFLVLIIFTSFSCFEKEAGCLDAEAVNFDVTADDDCCCEYPKLVLKMSHVYDDQTLILGSDLVNDINSPFEIISFQYYLSGFSYVDESNNTFSTTDRISLPQISSDDNVTTTDDFVLISRSFIRDSIGFFTDFGDYEKLEFEIGVKEIAQNTDPDGVDADHPLATQADSMWFENEGYVATKITLKPDTIDMTDTFTITIFDNQLFSLDGELELSRATHIDMELQTNYALWFRGIDFQNDNLETIKIKISANLANSLSFF